MALFGSRVNTARTRFNCFRCVTLTGMHDETFKETLKRFGWSVVTISVIVVILSLIGRAC